MATGGSDGSSKKSKRSGASIKPLEEPIPENVSNGNSTPEVGQGSPGRPLGEDAAANIEAVEEEGAHPVESPARGQERVVVRPVVPGEGGDAPVEMVDVLDVRRPPLFWWSEYKPGQRVIGTLMAIGVIYSFAQRMKEIHEYLSSNPKTKAIYYRFVQCFKLLGVFWMTLGFLFYDIYKIAARDFAPKTVYMYFHDFEKFLKYLYHRVDKWIASKISRIIWFFPRMQETPVELLDDCIHQYRKDLCKIAHPSSENPRFKEIEESRAAKESRGRQIVPLPEDD